MLGGESKKWKKHISAGCLLTDNIPYAVHLAYEANPHTNKTNQKIHLERFEKLYKH